MKRRAGVRWMGVVLLALFAGPVAAVRGQTFSEFPIPTANSYPQDVALGSDGALWFTELNGNKIGRVTTAGVITEFPIPTAGSYPQGIAAGPDGALWFTEGGGGSIGRITTAGVVTEFTITANPSDSDPFGIAAGPDGALWFTEISGGTIGRITAAGVVTRFTIPTGGSYPQGIVAGPDGALWFTEFNANTIGRITTAGVITEFVLSVDADPFLIAAGPDGNLWFTELDNNRIGRITTSGVVTEFPVPVLGSQPNGIAAGPDGALWFTEQAGKIGRITTSGGITEFTVPTDGSGPLGIAAGPDGALWFTEGGSDRIGRITSGAAPAGCTPNATTLCLNAGRFKVQARWTTADGQAGVGQATPLTGDTGDFWFFSSNNIEMIIKVVDGRGFNSRFWVFAGGLTNVNVVVTVTDTQTGTVKTYVNPQGTPFQPVQDTNAFPGSTVPGVSVRGPAVTDAAEETAGISAARARHLGRPARVARVSRPSAAGAAAACTADATTLCLNGGRFSLRTQWATSDGRSGAGQAVALTGDTGYFWFFSSNNVEMVVKALNACGFNSRFWVFAGGLTNVQVVLTVTDTQTGVVKTYTNPQGTPFQPIQDTSAFATCP